MYGDTTRFVLRLDEHHRLLGENEHRRASEKMGGEYRAARGDRVGAIDD